MLYCAAGKIAITPSRELIDSLRDNPRNRFTGVYSELSARIVVTSDGERRFVILTAELGMIPAQAELDERLKKELGVEPGTVFGCTHNHQSMLVIKEGEGPAGFVCESWMNTYMDLIHQKIIDGVKDCIGRLEPARMGCASGSSYIGVSRDYPSPIGTLQSSNFQGYSDHELSVIRFERLDGTAIALVVNYVCMGPSYFPTP